MMGCAQSHHNRRLSQMTKRRKRLEYVALPVHGRANPLEMQVHFKRTPQDRPYLSRYNGRPDGRETSEHHSVGRR